MTDKEKLGEDVIGKLFPPCVFKKCCEYNIGFPSGCSVGLVYDCEYYLALYKARQLNKSLRNFIRKALLTGDLTMRSNMPEKTFKIIEKIMEGKIENENKNTDRIN